MERKFLEHSLRRSESSTGAKVLWNESSWTFRSSGANVPWNESSTGAKVLSMVFSLPGTKVQRNEKASYPINERVGNLRTAKWSSLKTGPARLGHINFVICGLKETKIAALAIITQRKQTYASHVDLDSFTVFICLVRFS